MKKIITYILLAAMTLSVMTGCAEKKADGDEKISVVVTIFPEYDWVRELTKGNDNVEITMLLDKGVDLHSFQPSVDDIVKLKNCDMFIYVGGESDEWAEDALQEVSNKNMVVINLLESLGGLVKEEELVEGMEGEEEEEDGEEEEGQEYDEHVWLSLKNAEILCKAISDALSNIDPANAEKYEKNLKAYIEKLDQLDSDYEKAVEASSVKTVLFGDRFPFRYLVDDYKLDYYAAFVGCSAESEASFETITFLAKKTDELGLSAIFQIETADGRIAETIKNATVSKNQKILTLDSMQTVTAKDVAAGAKYIEIMKKNLDVLKEALK